MKTDVVIDIVCRPLLRFWFSADNFQLNTCLYHYIPLIPEVSGWYYRTVSSISVITDPLLRKFSANISVSYRSVKPVIFQHENVVNVHSILICLGQFHSLSNVILILKSHKILLAPLLRASSARPKHLLHIPLIGFSTVSAWLLLLFITLVVCYRFSFCILFTSPACL